MQKVVLKLDIHDNHKCRKKAMQIISTSPGVDSVLMNIKEQKITFTGNMDAITIVQNLRKVFRTAALFSAEPVKEPDKVVEEPENQAQMIESLMPDCYYRPTCPNYPACYLRHCYCLSTSGTYV